VRHELVTVAKVARHADCGNILVLPLLQGKEGILHGANHHRLQPELPESRLLVAPVDAVTLQDDDLFNRFLSHSFTPFV
jgi:hypothetical protein